jgi:homoserine kinase
MSVVSCATITVPATTANLGPGFDCIGAALTLYNEFKFIRHSQGRWVITVTGAEAERVVTDESNLLYQAFVKFYEYIEQSPPFVQIDILLGVPLARGLGSSATAIVGGLIGANVLAGEPLSQSQLLELAIALEGHPDNVVPAFLGGCYLAATGIENQFLKERQSVWSQEIVPVVAIPDFELSTKEARQVLTDVVSRGDAIFNTAHLGLLLRGLETGRGDWLRHGLQDRLHQPYRKGLIRGYDAVNSAAIGAGAYGMVISGAGPTLLALTDTASADAVGKAMADAWLKEDVRAEVRSLSLDTQGARLVIE